jgi:4'-phosphopantetheinyl transferase EntD
LETSHRLGTLQPIGNTAYKLTDERLSALFPTGVEVCFSATPSSAARLLPAEEAFTTDMVGKRHREFVHGRHCARRALEKLGAPPAAILKAEDRSPVWPAGIVGSISHSGEMAAAAVAYASELGGLGLDIESDEGLQPDVIAMVCRPEEQTDDGELAKLLFCAKEAIYKCIYPLVGTYVDFQEMSVTIHPHEGRFAAESHSKNIDPNLTRSLQGKYQRVSGLLVTGVWLPKRS